MYQYFTSQKNVNLLKALFFFKILFNLIFKPFIFFHRLHPIFEKLKIREKNWKQKNLEKNTDIAYKQYHITQSSIFISLLSFLLQMNLKIMKPRQTSPEDFIARKPDYLTTLFLVKFFLLWFWTELECQESWLNWKFSLRSFRQIIAFHRFYTTFLGQCSAFEVQAVPDCKNQRQTNRFFFDVSKNSTPLSETYFLNK